MNIKNALNKSKKNTIYNRYFKTNNSVEITEKNKKNNIIISFWGNINDDKGLKNGQNRRKEHIIMRRASYVNTNLDYYPQQEKVEKYKFLLRKTEIKWQNNWFNNLTGDKQEQYKKQVAEMKRNTPSILWTLETGKIQVEWKRNWFKNLTDDKKQTYHTEIKAIKEKIIKSQNK